MWFIIIFLDILETETNKKVELFIETGIEFFFEKIIQIKKETTSFKSAFMDQKASLLI